MVKKRIFEETFYLVLYGQNILEKRNVFKRKNIFMLRGEKQINKRRNINVLARKSWRKKMNDPKETLL